MRRRLFRYIIRDLAKHKEGELLPWWGVALHWLLFPLVSLNCLMQTKHGYDPYSDTWNINGLRISSNFFEDIKPGRVLEITEVDNGVITVRDKNEKQL